MRLWLNPGKFFYNKASELYITRYLSDNFGIGALHGRLQLGKDEDGMT
jgi:hypothetical protein